MTSITAHATPSWFRDRRYGMFIHANIATVPAFSPVHEYADWYWSHLEPKEDVVLHPTSPLPEVMAWHAEHWPGYAFDDFIPHLTYERFDADAYADLATAAGMRYVVKVAKHHDGFCWWDTALTDRNSVRLGPHRDVVAELADATRAAGLAFGTYYSLLDWAHPAFPDRDRYVDAFMRPQIAELVERFRPAVLWGDGHWGHGRDHWRSDRIVEDYYAVAERLGFEGAVNDRFFASHADFVTFEYDVPEVPPARPWEMCRGLAYSFCVNQAEEDDDHLQPAQIVAMLAETVAKGGNLLLNIGPRADGTVPAVQDRILRAAGEWVRAHADAIHGSEPFSTPGAGDHWYTVTPGIAGDGRTPRGTHRVNAIDLSGAAAPVFAALAHRAGRVVAVTGPDGAVVPFRQTEAGLVPERPGVVPGALGGLAAVYHATLEPVPEGAVVVRDVAGPGRVRCGGTEHATVTAALATTRPGDTVEVGPGRYGPATEAFPLTVPAGVTLRAEPGAVATAVVLDGGGHPVVFLAGGGATLQGLTVTGAATGFFSLPPTAVTSGGADRLAVRDCHLPAILLTGGSGHVVEGNVVGGGNMWLVSTSAALVRGNYQHGLRWGVGIELTGGDGHVVDGNECRDDLCAIRLGGTAGAIVEGNRYETRWFGIHLKEAVATVVRGNRTWRTMRAVNVEGGRDNLVVHQLAERCDTGALVERGAAGTRIADSWFHGCRVGVLTWDDEGTTVASCVISGSRDHAVVTNTNVAVEDTDLDGGEIATLALRAEPEGREGRVE